MKKILGSELHLKAKKGNTLIVVLCVMAMGIIIISPLLHYVETTTNRYKSEIVDTNAYYAADALMEKIMSDLYVLTNISLENQNGNYSMHVPNGWLNGYNASATINASPLWAAPPSLTTGGNYSITTTATRNDSSTGQPVKLVSITACLHTTDTLVQILAWQINWSPQ